MPVGIWHGEQDNLIKIEQVLFLEKVFPNPRVKYLRNEGDTLLGCPSTLCPS